jgi:hypothetical protein
MDNRENTLNRNDYEGNGWSKYQKLVMAQLEDHTRILDKINSDNNEIKQKLALMEQSTQIWRENITTKITELRNDVDYMWNDEKGFNARIKNLEDSIKIEQQSALKFKGSWALIGGIGVIVLDLGMKALEFFLHKP